MLHKISEFKRPLPTTPSKRDISGINLRSKKRSPLKVTPMKSPSSSQLLNRTSTQQRLAALIKSQEPDPKTQMLGNFEKVNYAIFIELERAKKPHK